MTIKASLDGINEYAYNSDANRLRGCVNDAHNVLAHLVKRAKAEIEHTMLLDQKATKQAIMANWRLMLSRCAPGDILVIGHSSHGIEEGICCYNLGVKDGAWDPDGLISYHEIAEFTKEIPETIMCEILIDACHCERRLKSLGRVYGKAKYMQAQGAITTPPRPIKPTTVAPNVAMWAACEPLQTSADAYIDNQAQGAFTASFIKFDDGRSRSDVIFFARRWLAEQGYEQIPHLYTSYQHAMEKWL